MRTLFLAVAFVALPLAAIDVSGKWSGKFVDLQDEAKSEPVFMILKQEGSQLSGSGGPTEDEQHPIQNGKVEGDKLAFEIPTGKGTIYFDLKATDTEIKGEMKRTRGDRTDNARLSLKRVGQK
jgi:hypothetical protein